MFSSNVSRAIRIANRLKAGTVWVNAYGAIHAQVPFGGYKRMLPVAFINLAVRLHVFVESGIGRELGKYALDNYTQVKAVQINLTTKAPVV